MVLGALGKSRETNTTERNPRSAKQEIWTAARSILAVLAGIVAMTAAAFPIEIPLRWLTLRWIPQAFRERATLELNVGCTLSLLLYTVLAAKADVQFSETKWAGDA